MELITSFDTTRQKILLSLIESYEVRERRAFQIAATQLVSPVDQIDILDARDEKVLSAKDRESQNIMKWFNRFYSNRSGTIDIKEFSAALKTMGFKLHKKEVKTLMERFDREGDGEIDYKEFAIWLKSNEDTLVKRRYLHEVLQIMQKIYIGSIRQEKNRKAIKQ